MNFDKSTHSNLAPLVAEFRQSSPVAGGATLLKDMSKFVKGHGLTHGHTVDGISKEYKTWWNIRERCYSKNHKSYPRYGALGIRICDRWLERFENFLDDMGHAPSPLHSIDRIDGNGNYEPGNCRWATYAQQALNRKSNHYLTIAGERLTIKEWAEKMGIQRHIIDNRLKRGWSEEDAVKIPLHSLWRYDKNRSS